MTRRVDRIPMPLPDGTFVWIPVSEILDRESNKTVANDDTVIREARA